MANAFLLPPITDHTHTHRLAAAGVSVALAHGGKEGGEGERSLRLFMLA